MTTQGDAMTWFLITVVGFLSLMVIGTYVAMHSYDAHQRRHLWNGRHHHA